MVLSASKVTIMGFLPLPAWEPSQYGPFFDNPQAQNAFLSPAFTSILNGPPCQLVMVSSYGVELQPDQ
jgi:hypothetical protein